MQEVPPGRERRASRKVSFSASVPGWMYRILEKETFERNVSFSQVVAEWINRGLAYDRLVKDQEREKAQMLLEVIKDGEPEGSS